MSKIIFPIDLALSGGGSRAAAFHLGCLSLLHKIRLSGADKSPTLLSQLRALSTVSGGTFTGATYVLSLAEATPFDDFFKDFYNDLGTIKIIKEGIEYLVKGKARVPSKRQNLIVSMAEVYANTFLKTKSGQSALLGDIIQSPNFTLRGVFFNTTEFSFGSTFHFQTGGPSGNTCMPPVPQTAVQYIRLADIVAASSCIPAGFEPIVFPDDFVWPNGVVPPAVRQQFPEPGVPLMDGGIYDNQGGESLRFFQELECSDADQPRLVIISDVSPEPRDLYDYQDPIKKGTFPFLRWKVKTHLRILRAIFLLSGLSALGFMAATIRYLMKYGLDKDFLYNLLYVVPLGTALLTSYVLWFANRRLKEIAETTVPQIDEKVWDNLQQLSLRKVLEMAIIRLTSVIALTSSVFMTRVRELVYEVIDGKKQYAAKHVHCLIYDLHSGHPFDGRLTHLGLPKVSGSPLQAVIDSVYKLETAMWFDLPWQIPCLVVTGQATLCYNLMRHLLDVHEQLNGKGKLWGLDEEEFQKDLPSDLGCLWTQLAAQWRMLVQYPCTLLREHLPGVNPCKPAS